MKLSGARGGFSPYQPVHSSIVCLLSHSYVGSLTTVKDNNIFFLFQVTIENVKNVYPIRVVFSSPLTLINSHAMFIDMLDSATLTLRNSSTNYLALDHQQNTNVTKSPSHDLDLQNATVRNLHIVVNGLRVDSSNIEQIIKCKIFGKALVSSTQISSLCPHALFVERDASLQLTDVTIDEIKEGGLIVEGNLLMRNVLVKRLARHAIILGKRAGRVTFENVVIENGTHDSIVDLNTKMITISNMTLNGNSHLVVGKGLKVVPEKIKLGANDHSEFNPYIFNNGTHRMLGFLETDDGRVLTELVNATKSVVEQKYVALIEWVKAKKLQSKSSVGTFPTIESALEITYPKIKDNASMSSPTSFAVSISNDLTITNNSFSVVSGSTKHEQTEESSYQKYSLPVTSATTLAMNEMKPVMNNLSSVDFVTKPCTNCSSSSTNLPVHSLKSSETLAQQHSKKMLPANRTTEHHMKDKKAQKSLSSSLSSDRHSAVRNELVVLGVVVSMIGAYVFYFVVV